MTNFGAKTGVSIRDATVADAAVVAKLLTELNETVGAVGMPSPQCFEPRYAHASAEQVAARMQKMKDVEHVIIAEVNGAPAGMTSVRLVPYLDQDTPYAEITQMHVRPEYRRQRVGAALIEAVEAKAKASGATAVHIWTGNNNLTGQAFYAAVGYEQDSVKLEKFIETGG